MTDRILHSPDGSVTVALYPDLHAKVALRAATGEITVRAAGHAPIETTAERYADHDGDMHSFVAALLAGCRRRS